MNVQALFQTVYEHPKSCATSALSLTIQYSTLPPNLSAHRRPLWPPPAPAPLPAWLTPSPQHCCSWLASPAATKQAPAPAGVHLSRQHAAAHGRTAPPVGATLPQQQAGPGGDPQQGTQQDATHHVPINSGAAAHQADASGDEDVSAPAAKSEGLVTVASQSTSNPHTHMPWPAAGSWLGRLPWRRCCLSSSHLDAESAWFCFEPG